MHLLTEWVTSEFMASQTGQQTITIHILLSISINNGNQSMKFGYLIKCSVRNIFLQNHVENQVGRQVEDVLVF